jgi:hypothetical protein
VALGVAVLLGVGVAVADGVAVRVGPVGTKHTSTETLDVRTSSAAAT